ncbi:MAG: hypothetical protein ACTSW2_00385 [Alphaproteobacteria bacterium]
MHNSGTYLRRTAEVLAVSFLLAGCSLTDEALLPSLTGETPSSASTQTAAAVTPESDSASPSAGPRFGTTVFETPGITSAQPSGTHVGQKIEELRADLARLQTRMSEHNDSLQGYRSAARQSATAYHNLVGEINARLQVGTTPGNPELVAQWNEAQGELNKVGESISSLNTLSNEASSTSALAAFLLESTRATFGLRGAIEEDHRQLAVLEDEVNKTVVVIDRLLNELTEDVARSQNYFAAERSNLTAMQVAIDNGEYIGSSLASRAYGVPAPAPAGGASSLVGQRQPLVVIRFNESKVEYEQALFTAISRALDRKPNAGFDLVAVAPNVGTPAQVSLATSRSRRNAEGVLRTLTNMGLPADRITLSATSSANAQVNEVHVYVR